MFEIDYLNLIRGGMSRTRVSSGQVTQTGGDSATNLDERRRRQRRHAGDDNGNEPDDGLRHRHRQQLGFLGGAAGDADGDHGQRAEGRQIVVNAQSGVVFARGMPEELRAIADYLERIHGAAKRQVVLEAKIIEVTLSDGFQAGVNWAAVQVQADGDTIGRRQPVGGPRQWAPSCR